MLFILRLILIVECHVDVTFSWEDGSGEKYYVCINIIAMPHKSWDSTENRGTLSTFWAVRRLRSIWSVAVQINQPKTAPWTARTTIVYIPNWPQQYTRQSLDITHQVFSQQTIVAKKREKKRREKENWALSMKGECLIPSCFKKSSNST